MVQKAEEKYKNVISTGDFNSKSYFWGNKDKNAEGIILENFIMNTDFICVNDGAPTRRNARSVIDLFLVKPQVYRMKKVNKQCLLDTPRTVRVSEKTWQVIVRTRRP